MIRRQKASLQGSPARRAAPQSPSTSRPASPTSSGFGQRPNDTAGTRPSRTNPTTGDQKKSSRQILDDLFGSRTPRNQTPGGGSVHDLFSRAASPTHPQALSTLRPTKHHQHDRRQLPYPQKRSCEDPSPSETDAGPDGRSRWCHKSNTCISDTGG